MEPRRWGGTLRFQNPEPDGGRIFIEAGTALKRLGIESDGTIKGCPSLNTEKWAGGNVREHRLIEIWERAAPLRYTRDRTEADLWGYCRTCYYASLCEAGCTWTSESLLGRPGNNPMCHHRALEFQRAGKRERLVRAESAPGRPFDQGRCKPPSDGKEAKARRSGRLKPRIFGTLLTVTIDQIVSAIRALPVLERLRVVEIVAHEAASDVPAALAESAPTRGVTLAERNGLLVVDSDASVTADAFDHRLDREARADRIWGGGS